MTLRMRGLLLLSGCFYTVGCGGTNQSQRSSGESSSVPVLRDIALIKKRCGNNVVAFANASIAERIYTSGKPRAVRPIMVDCRIHTVGGKTALMMDELNVRKDTDSLSIFFFDGDGVLREIVRRVTFVGDIAFEVDQITLVVEEVPLADFDKVDGQRIEGGRGNIKIPRGTPMALASHTRAGVMSNAVPVRMVP